MHIAISNSILSSSNSRSIPASTTERFEIQDCVGSSGNFISNDYPIGGFVEGDRVTFNNGVDAFGIVLNVTTNPSSGVDIVGTGVNTTQCIDNYLNLYHELIAPLSQELIIFKYNLQAITTSFISTDDEYEFAWGYYYVVYVEWDNGEESGSEVFTFTNSGGLLNYNISEGNSLQLAIQGDNAEGPISFISIDYGYSYNPNFPVPTIASFTNDDCSYPYFMRTQGTQSGSTFFINYASEC